MKNTEDFDDSKEGDRMKDKIEFGFPADMPPADRAITVFNFFVLLSFFIPFIVVGLVIVFALIGG